MVGERPTPDTLARKFDASAGARIVAMSRSLWCVTGEHLAVQVVLLKEARIASLPSLDRSRGKSRCLDGSCPTSSAVHQNARETLLALADRGVAVACANEAALRRGRHCIARGGADKAEGRPNPRRSSPFRAVTAVWPPPPSALAIALTEAHGARETPRCATEVDGAFRVQRDVRSRSNHRDVDEMSTRYRRRNACEK